MEVLLGFLVPMVEKYPALAGMFFVIGALRVVLKPLFSILHAYVIYSPNAADDALLEQVENSKAVKGIFWVLDYLASIKLVK